MEWNKPVKEVPPTNASGANPAPQIPQANQPAWGEDIRAYYHAAAEEPVPQDFVDLMAQIAKQIGK
jgi:hypothetical protein